MLSFKTPGGHLEVLGGKPFISLGNLTKSRTDCHQIWYVSADSSGNGHRLKQLALRDHRRHFFRVLRGKLFKKPGKDGETAGPFGTK